MRRIDHHDVGCRACRLTVPIDDPVIRPMARLHTRSFHEVLTNSRKPNQFLTSGETSLQIRLVRPITRKAIRPTIRIIRVKRLSVPPSKLKDLSSISFRQRHFIPFFLWCHGTVTPLSHGTIGNISASPTPKPSPSRVRVTATARVRCRLGPEGLVGNRTRARGAPPTDP